MKSIRQIALLGFAMLSLATPVLGQEPYASANAAYSAGMKFIQEGNLAACREPLEAALEMAPDDAFRMRVCKSLLVPYRELPEIEPMQQAAEYVITHSEQPGERSSTRGALLSFIHKRGKLDAAVQAYEESLKKSPEDRTLLFILTEAHASLKKNPVRSVELAERLAAVEKKLGKGQDAASQAQMAQQLAKAGKPREAAELYERIAAMDAGLAAWHYKEAGAAWLKAGDKTKALAAARKSDSSAPEGRSELLAYFWHKGLGDVYLDAGTPKEAIPHYEQALARTSIEGYITECREKLEKAQTAARK